MGGERASCRQERRLAAHGDALFSILYDECGGAEWRHLRKEASRGEGCHAMTVVHERSVPDGMEKVLPPVQDPFFVFLQGRGTHDDPSCSCPEKGSGGLMPCLPESVRTFSERRTVAGTASEKHPQQRGKHGSCLCHSATSVSSALRHCCKKHPQALAWKVRRRAHAVFPRWGGGKASQYRT